MTISFDFQDLIAWITYLIQHQTGESLMNVIDRINAIDAKLTAFIQHHNDADATTKAENDQLKAQVADLQAQLEAAGPTDAVNSALDALEGHIPAETPTT